MILSVSVTTAVSMVAVSTEVSRSCFRIRSGSAV